MIIAFIDIRLFKQLSNSRIVMVFYSISINVIV